ncbi:hypothetical protein V6N12_059212 [Hibiscus sabdariffa]|uniref:Reverse transcriptase zinc-binding domain-containing protein n=1 Tax=Hibiscus sabdariffa TaxID=183260 RepID=A0ABR2EUG9_9ROSI
MVSGCGICGANLEDIDHIFRRCPVAVTLWNSLLHSDHLPEFYSLPIKAWLLANLSSSRTFATADPHWDLFFGSILWGLWPHRNDMIFNPHLVLRDSVLQRASRVRHACLAALAPAHGTLHQDRRLPREQVVWCRPKLVGIS